MAPPDLDGDAVIRVLLVDDHQMVAESVRRGLEREGDMAIVGVLHSGNEVMAAVAGLSPDVVVLDFALPDTDGVAVTREVLADAPDTKILLLAGAGDEELVAAAVNAGCVGYLEKSMPFSDLAQGIRRANRGEFVLSAAQLSNVLRSQAGAPEVDLLTRRETEILGLMSEGMVNRVIADRLNVSVDTVRTHVQNILGKLGAHSRLEAVAEARRRGLVA